MKDRFNLSILAVRQGVLTGFLLLLVLLMGAVAWNRLGRAEDPSFTLKVMVVSAAWPGATAEQMQDLVAERIESKLQDLAWLERTETYSQPGQSVVTVLLKDTTPPRLVPEMWYQVRKKVGDIRQTLPSGVQGPFFDDEYGDVYSAVLALTGADNAELIRQAERLRLRLLRVPGVEKVSIQGEQAQQVRVEISHARLATLGITPQAVMEALARHNPVAPAGAIETGSTRLHLRVEGGLDGLEAIRVVPVAAGPLSIRLGDIAAVSRGVQDPAERAIRQDGEGAVLLAIAKRKGENVLAMGEALKAALAEIRAGLPAGLALTPIADQPHVVQESVSEFLMKFAAAIGVVLLISFLSLGFSAGIIVALCVPLTLSMVMLCLLQWGTELERVSLGALILALGLLVDDAIIAIEAMIVKLEQGWEKVKAAGFAWTSTAGPMLSGTLVTVAGFIPVGFANSTSGEYAGGIFWVVGAALIASWLVAVVFTPWLGVKLLRVKPHAGGGHDVYDSRFYRAFRAMVTWCVNWRWAVLGASLLVLLAGFAGMGKVRQQFFPVSQRLELLVDVNLRSGAGLEATDALARRIEALLKGDPDAPVVTTYLGAGAPRFFLALNPDLPNTAFAKLIIQTPDIAARERLRERLTALAGSGAFPEARVRVSRLDFGPPVGYPLQFRVMGPDPVQLRRAADQLMAELRNTPGAQDVQLAWGERAPALRLVLDPDRAAQLGLTPDSLATSLQTLLSGAVATQLREGTRLVNVVLRAPGEERLSVEGLPDLSVMTPSGAVPLAQIARVETVMEEPILWRRNREGFLTVRADVAPGFQPIDVTRAFLPRLAELSASLPPGYRLEPGGAAEESEKANASIFSLFPVMGMVMVLILMIQLRHVGRVALVLATAPLGIPGAAAALLVMDAPFGFVALLGVIALAGMIMRNTLILVDQVRQDLEEGLPLREAIIGSTVRRARPVVLTALAAVLAFIPLTLSAFWGPMAIAMIGGLLVATVATLLVVPALYGMALGREGRARSALRLSPAE